MIVIPLQFFGVGDIIFTQTLVRRIANGNPILWPVLPAFVEGLQRAYPDITFIDYTKVPVNYDSKEQYVTTFPNIGECTVLPIRWADTILKVPYTECMSAKYKMYGMDWREWKEQAMWKRDEAKEAELMEQVCSYEKMHNDYEDKPILINRFFRSDMSGVAAIPHKGIEMCNIDGYSIFDWALLMQNVTAIHTVSTSIIYLLEMLDIQCPIHLYPRNPDEMDFRNVDYLLQKHNYIKHL